MGSEARPVPPAPVRSAPRLVVRLSHEEAIVRRATRRGPRHGRASADHDPEALARAAVAACREAGTRPGACVVVLAGELLEQQLVELPALRTRDLTRVVPRRAAQLLELEDLDQVQAAAQPLGDPPERDEAEADEEPPREWLLLAARSRSMERLFVALRRHGFRVERAVPSLLASVQHLASTRPREGSFIAVVAEPGSTGVAMVSRGRVHHVAFLAESLEEPDQAVALRLVQELRQLGAFSRRGVRGGEVREVLTLGVSAPWLELIEPAIHAALGGAPVRPMDGTDQGLDERQVLLEGPLAAAGAGAVHTVDLRPRLPVRASRILIASTVLLALAGTLGLELTFDWRTRALAYRDRLQRRGALARELPELEQRAQEVRLARSSFEAELERLRALVAEGLPLAELLADVERATAPGVQIDSLTLDGEQGTLDLGGTTLASVDGSQRCLGFLCEQLRAGGRVEAVDCRPSGSLPEASGSPRLEFRVVARLTEEAR